MRTLGRYVFHIFALLMVGYFTLPMIVAVLMSFTPTRFLRLPTAKWSLRWYEAFFNDLKWMEGLWNSLIVSGITIVFSLVVGMTAALAFSRAALQQNGDDAERIDSLQLMGRVYERAGDHASAALCFAGAAPSTEIQVTNE